MAREAKQTIESVMAEFLTEQRARLADKTYRKYEDVALLLQQAAHRHLQHVP